MRELFKIFPSQQKELNAHNLKYKTDIRYPLSTSVVKQEICYVTLYDGFVSHGIKGCVSKDVSLNCGINLRQKQSLNRVNKQPYIIPLCSKLSPTF